MNKSPSIRARAGIKKKKARAQANKSYHINNHTIKGEKKKRSEKKIKSLG